MENYFSVEHQSFYNEFDIWRKNMIGQKQPANGVYILFANKKINRLIGSDDKGILYIGKGNILNINNRVGKLINAINKTETRHDGGVRLQNKKIIQLYPLSEMSLKISLNENSEREEKRLLNEYEQTYGELPPFNQQRGLQTEYQIKTPI